MSNSEAADWEAALIKKAREIYPDYETGGYALLANLSEARYSGASGECLKELQEIAENAGLVRMVPRE